MTQNIEHSKLELIQWILEMQSHELLLALLAWKAQQKKEREAKFLSAFGGWRGNSTDMMEDIYGSRHFEDRDIVL